MHDDDVFDDMPPELLATLDRVRAHYGHPAPPVAGPVLSAFLSVGLTNDNGDLSATAASNANEPAEAQVVGLPNWRTTLTQRRRQAMRMIAAFIGTTLGKVALGATVAAASVGAGQASGVIDINADPAPTEDISDDGELEADDIEGDESQDVEADEVDDDEADELDEVEVDEVEVDEVEVDEVEVDEVDDADEADDEVEVDEPDEADDDDEVEVDEPDEADDDDEADGPDDAEVDDD